MRSLTVDQLAVQVYDDLPALARAAAADAGAALRAAIDGRGEANVMLATGNSQLAFLAELVRLPGIAWDRVRAFHMDEYVGLAPSHSASFQRYMRERVASQLPVKEFNYVNGDTGDAAAAPPALAEWLRRIVSSQEATVEAAVTGSRAKAVEAMMLDPLAGRIDYDHVEQMTDEMLAATSQWLPQFA